MKKIILALMLLSTFAFALPSYIIHPANGITYKFDSVLRTYNSNRGTNVGSFSSYLWSSWASAGYEECTLQTEGQPYSFYKCVEGNYLTDTGTCQAPNQIINGECVNPNPPQCGEGTYLNPATLSCVPTYPIADEETLESGSKNIIFEDGAMMIVNPDGTAVTFAPDGAKIRYYVALAQNEF